MDDRKHRRIMILLNSLSQLCYESYYVNSKIMILQMASEMSHS